MPVSTVFWPKGGQMLSDLNSEISFGIFSSYRNFLAPICNDLQILIFRPPIAISKFEIAGSTDNVFFGWARYWVLELWGCLGDWESLRPLRDPQSPDGATDWPGR